MNQQNNKDIPIQIVDNATVLPARDMWIFSPTDGGMQLDLANKTENEGDVKIEIFERIIIPKEKMKTFLYRYIDAIFEYEEKFHDGFGLKSNKEKND